MAVTKTVLVDIQTGNSAKNLEDVKKSLQDVKAESQKAADASKEVGNAVDKATGGAVSKLKGLTTSIKTVTNGFNLMKIAIIGTGIGALLVAVFALKSAFTASEEGQNKWAKIMTRIGSITGNIIDLFATLGEKLIWVFENPKQAINDFANLLKTQIVNRFTGMLELIPAVGRAVKLVFEGKFKEAGVVASNAMGKVALGVEDVTSKIKLAGEELKKWQAQVADDDKKAQIIADKRARAQKLALELTVQIAQAELKRNELLGKAEERDKYSKEQQKQFLIDAGKVDEAITNKKLDQAQLLYDAQVLENGLNKSKAADLDKEAELQANLINIESQKVAKAKEVTAKISAINLEASAKAQSLRDKAKADEQKVIDDAAKTEEEKQAKILAIREKFRIDNENLLDVTEVQKVERQYTRDNAELDALKATEEQKIELIANYKAKLKAAELADAEAEKAKVQEKRDKEIADLEAKSANDLYTFEERLKADEEKTALLLMNDKLTEDERTKITEDGVKARVELAKLEAKAKIDALDAYGDAFAKIGELVGKHTVAGKALSVAAALISTYTSATKAYESQLTIPTPDAPIRAALAAGVAVATGLANVKAILAVKVPGSNGSGQSTASPGAPAVKSLAPSFNVVGTSGTNQLAASIGETSKTPIKAYVVSTEISSQQELDRNIQSEATFG